MHGNDEENKSICFGDTRLRIVADDIHRVYIWVQNSGLYCIRMEPYCAESCYDSEMRYVGKGPVGYYELLSEVTVVAEKLQKCGFIKNKFGKSVPIIIHDLEYPWYIIKATKTANPGGEANAFLAAMKALGITD